MASGLIVHPALHVSAPSLLGWLPQLPLIMVSGLVVLGWRPSIVQVLWCSINSNIALSAHQRCLTLILRQYTTGRAIASRPSMPSSKWKMLLCMQREGRGAFHAGDGTAVRQVDARRRSYCTARWYCMLDGFARDGCSSGRAGLQRMHSSSPGLASSRHASLQCAARSLCSIEQLPQAAYSPALGFGARVPRLQCLLPAARAMCGPVCHKRSVSLPT
jgi:hypothetical protein